MKIGFRTIKTAVGAGFSLWFAQLLGLEFYTTAATITILCIERTRKKSFQTAVNRLFACFISLMLSWLIFENIGYGALSFSLIIIFLIPLLIQLKLEKGFLTSVVIPIHLLSLAHIDWHVIQNEFFVILIGITVGMLLNMYMPNQGKELMKLKEEIEKDYKKILYEFSRQLEKGSQGWDKKELEDLPDLLERAEELAVDVAENSLTKDRKALHDYFQMRRKQLDILERMAPIIEDLSMDIPQRQMFAHFLYTISNNINDRYESPRFLARLYEERDKMDALALPKTTEEMKNRSMLFQLTNEMTLYFETKIKYHQSLEDNEKTVD